MERKSFLRIDRIRPREVHIFLEAIVAAPGQVGLCFIVLLFFEMNEPKVEIHLTQPATVGCFINVLLTPPKIFDSSRVFLEYRVRNLRVDDTTHPAHQKVVVLRQLARPFQHRDGLFDPRDSLHHGNIHRM